MTRVEFVDLADWLSRGYGRQIRIRATRHAFAVSLRQGSPGSAEIHTTMAYGETVEDALDEAFKKVPVSP